MERLLSAEMGLIVIVEIDEELVLTMVVLQDGYNNYRKKEFKNIILKNGTETSFQWLNRSRSARKP